MSLEDVFNESAEDLNPEAEQVEEQEVVKEEVTETTAEDAEDIKEEETSESDVKAETKDADKQDWTLAAVKDERRKRQELERERDELKARLDNGKKDLPDVFDDQKGFADQLRNEYKQELSKAKLDIAREIMIDSHNDYEEMETLFLEKIAKDYPVVAEEARKSSNPAKYVYSQAKKYKEFQAMQDIDSVKDQMRAEIRAELLGQQKSNVSSIKPSLAKARASVNDKKVNNVSLDTLFNK